MMPSTIIQLGELPLTPNFKIDRQQLSVMDINADGDLHTSAATPIEEALVRIFKEVLDRERVSITDSFFAMGGDSIIGIQIVSRSNAEGIKVTLKQVFTEQTIERIAAVAEMTVAAVCEQGPVSGPVELMPVHKWFFEQDFANRSHYNQFDIGNPYRKIRPFLG